MSQALSPPKSGLVRYPGAANPASFLSAEGTALPRHDSPRCRRRTLTEEGLIATIVLADDDARFREYLRALLAMEPSADLVGEAEAGEGALELVEALNPDLLLVDLAMPGLNGIETTRRALSFRPRLKVIVITLHDDRRMVDAALEAGASGYLLKDHLDEELSRALARVGHGDTFLSAGLARAGSHQEPSPRVRERPESS